MCYHAIGTRVCYKTTQVANKSQQISELHTTAVSGSSKHGLNRSTLGHASIRRRNDKSSIDLFDMLDDFITCTHITLKRLLHHGCRPEKKKLADAWN